MTARGKLLAAAAAVLVAAGLPACAGEGAEDATGGHEQLAGSTGGTEAGAGSERSEQAERPALKMSEKAVARLPKIRVPKRSGPPPRSLVVRDIRKGWGATVPSNGAVEVRYFSVSYATAERKATAGAFGPTPFGMDEVIGGWKVGLPGMRVGGRRELVVPPQLHFKEGRRYIGRPHWTSVYVIDLVGVERF